MSNFQTLTQLHGGYPGGAPGSFNADTTDTLATIIATGYLNDLINPLSNSTPIKNGDVFFINYDTDGTPGGGQFSVVVSGGNYSLLGGNAVQYTGATATTYSNFAVYSGTNGDITDLGFHASDISTPVISSVVGAVGTGHFAKYFDTAGSVQDSGFGYAEVLLTPAQVYAMYAAPITIVPAAGANTIICPISGFITMLYNTTAYSGAGTAALQWGTTAAGLGLACSISVGLTGSSNMTLALNVGFVDNNAGTINQPITISNITGAFSAGNSPVRISLLYLKISI